MHKRSTAKRFAVAATVLALAAPVWATEIEMKKKEDPKKAQKAAEADKQKAGETSSSQPNKKNCPENQFNTLEDLFGAVGPLTLQPVPATTAQQAKAAPAATAAAAKPAAPAVEWRAVQAPDKTAKPKPESEEKKKD